MKLHPLFLLGATAVGKSEFALALARQLRAAGQPCSILCLDAMQVYRGADIGTGKPTAADRAEFPHGGLDLVDLGQPFDVATYLRHAAEFLTEQRSAGRRVLIVGGTGLYFRALTQGLCEAPTASPELRAELVALSTPELQLRLRAADPQIYAQLDVQNPRRLQRALEVIATTGKSLLAWQAETPPPRVPNFTALWLQRDKADLQDRIAQRVETMLHSGWPEEVAQLITQHGREVVEKFVAIGYRELAQEPKLPLALNKRLLENIIIATRQYANRQLTWFAREPNLVKVMVPAVQPLAPLAQSPAISRHLSL